MKKIRIDLPIDGEQVATLDDLRNHFTTEIIDHFHSGLLARWLGSRDMAEELKAVERLADDAPADDAVALKALCGIFDVEAEDEVIELALLRATGASGIRLDQQDEFMAWFISATYYLTRLVSSRHIGSGVGDYPELYGFEEVELSPSSSSADKYDWHECLADYMSHCLAISKLMESCPNKAFSDCVGRHLVHHLARASTCYGLSGEEYFDLLSKAAFADTEESSKFKDAGIALESLKFLRQASLYSILQYATLVGVTSLISGAETVFGEDEPARNRQRMVEDPWRPSEALKQALTELDDEKFIQSIQRSELLAPVLKDDR